MSQSLVFFPLPTGQRPLGIDIVETGDAEGNFRIYVVVANSGEDSVSVFELADGLVRPTATVRGIPGPHGVAACPNPDGRVVVTSPAHNSVTVIKLPEATVLGSIPVGREPYSVACFWVAGKYIAVVSNFGDSTLMLIDLDSMAVTAEVPNIPGGRGWRTVSVVNVPNPGQRSSNFAWVAGTEADQVTVLELATLQVVVRLAVPRPTAVREGTVASEADNSLMTFDRTTWEIFGKIQDVPNPQDTVFSALGRFATTGKDLLWRMDPGSLPPGPNVVVTTIPDIPGTAGIAAYSLAGRTNRPATILFVTSPPSNSLFVTPVGGGVRTGPADYLVQHGASFRQVSSTGVIAPGTLASAFAATGVSRSFFAESLPVPVTLGGLTVRVGGSLTFDITTGWNYSPVGSVEAPLLFVGPNQINFQIPPGTSLGDGVPVQLQRPDGTTLLSTIQVGEASPGIFTLLQNGHGQAAVLNQDNTLNGNPETILGAQRAARGSVIQIFATGAGATMPPLLTGEPAPASGDPLVFTEVQPTVMIGGKEAQVLFSGMAPGFVGLWQINAEVPPDVTLGPAVPLQIIAGGVTSNPATIAVN